MTINKKWGLLPLTALVLFISACSDNKSTLTENTKNTENPAVAQGNWQAKKETLSTNDATDIQADLAALTQITNHANSEGLKLRTAVNNAINDPQQMQTLFKSGSELQRKTKDQIMALNLKSAEVQNIRTLMIDNLMTTGKMYDLALGQDFDIKKPSAEFVQLSQRSIQMQNKISTDLDQLTAQYTK